MIENSPGATAVATARRRWVLGVMAAALILLFLASILYRAEHPALSAPGTQQAVQMATEGPATDEASVRVLMEQLQNRPDDPDALLTLAGRFMHMGAFDQAMIFLDKALVSDPGNPRILQFKGAALFHLQRYAEAQDYFIRVLELEPDNASVHYNLGILQKHYLDAAREATTHFKAVLASSSADEGLKDAARKELE